MKINHLPVSGRIRHCFQNWNILTTDPWILQVVKGLRIEFSIPVPVQINIPNEITVSSEQMKIIDQEVQSLLEKQAIHKVPNYSKGFVSQLFIVDKKDGGKRPVVNLRNLNQYLEYFHFKMEGIHLVRDMIQRGDWLVKLDLKDAYLTIPIHREFQKYLQFKWKGQILEFSCLPFGLSVAPYVFTKMMKVPVTYFRRLGIRLVIYLDDILIMSQSQQNIMTDIQIVISVLEGLGFMINHKKSVLSPSHQIEFLGFLVNSQEMSLSLPSQKIKKIKKTLHADDRKSKRHSEGSVRINRKSDSYNTSNFPCPSPLSISPACKASSSAQIRRLQHNCNPIPTSTGRVKLVAPTCTKVKQKDFNIISTISHNPDRCKRSGMGSCASEHSDRGSLVVLRNTTAHQCKRIASNKSCSESISEGQIRYSGSDSNRQQNRHDICEQNGGHSVNHLQSGCSGSLELVPPSQHYTEGRLYSGIRERESRLGVTSSQRFQQLDAESTNISFIHEENNSMQCRFICRSNKCPAEEIHELDAGPRSHSIRRSSSPLDRNERVCISPILFDFNVSEKKSGRRK